MINDITSKPDLSATDRMWNHHYVVHIIPEHESRPSATVSPEEHMENDASPDNGNLKTSCCTPRTHVPQSWSFQIAEWDNSDSLVVIFSQCGLDLNLAMESFWSCRSEGCAFPVTWAQDMWFDFVGNTQSSNFCKCWTVGIARKRSES